MINKKLVYFRDDFNFRFNQNLLLDSVLLLMFYTFLVIIGNNNGSHTYFGKATSDESLVFAANRIGVL